MKLYGGMDLHSTNVVTQLINEEDKVIYLEARYSDGQAAQPTKQRFTSHELCLSALKTLQ